MTGFAGMFSGLAGRFFIPFLTRHICLLSVFAGSNHPFMILIFSQCNVAGFRAPRDGQKRCRWAIDLVGPSPTFTTTRTRKLRAADRRTGCELCGLGGETQEKPGRLQTAQDSPAENGTIALGPARVCGAGSVR